MSEPPSDLLENSLKIFLNFLILEPQYSQIHEFQHLGPSLIILPSVLMDGAVKLNHQSRFVTIEISYVEDVEIRWVSVNRMLAQELLVQ